RSVAIGSSRCMAGHYTRTTRLRATIRPRPEQSASMSNTEPRWVPAGTARIEIRVVNSRFIGTAGPAASVDEAKAFIAGVRAEMPDATHHVFAYVIGHGATKIEGMSDDGEPSGTAGRPTLAV